jgi:hypothetical protein
MPHPSSSIRSCLVSTPCDLSQDRKWEWFEQSKIRRSLCHPFVGASAALISESCHCQRNVSDIHLEEGGQMKLLRSTVVKSPSAPCPALPCADDLAHRAANCRVQSVYSTRTLCERPKSGKSGRWRLEMGSSAFRFMLYRIFLKMTGPVCTQGAS